MWVIQASVSDLLLGKVDGEGGSQAAEVEAGERKVSDKVQGGERSQQLAGTYLTVCMYSLWSAVLYCYAVELRPLPLQDP